MTTEECADANVRVGDPLKFDGRRAGGADEVIPAMEDEPVDVVPLLSTPSTAKGSLLQNWSPRSIADSSVLFGSDGSSMHPPPVPEVVASVVVIVPEPVPMVIMRPVVAVASPVAASDVAASDVRPPVAATPEVEGSTDPVDVSPLVPPGLTSREQPPTAQSKRLHIRLLRDGRPYITVVCTGMDLHIPHRAAAASRR